MIRTVTVTNRSDQMLGFVLNNNEKNAPWLLLSGAVIGVEKLSLCCLINCLINYKQFIVLLQL